MEPKKTMRRSDQAQRPADRIEMFPFYDTLWIRSPEWALLYQIVDARLGQT
ncbi:MAG TPA: hypothetical protein VNW97_04105 [Candidatus Saccharimonadales bacterium]|nr:hypothetical protein [Candidatus Saccharimonadales bacterium]